MQRTQIDLSQQERQGLQALIREAIDAFLQQQQPQARGLWAERSELPDWSTLRGELDRTPLAEAPCDPLRPRDC